MLQDCNFNNGSGLDDATKIQHFKSGIRPEAGLEVALTTSRSNPTYRGFDHLVSFLSAEVDQKKIRGQQVATSTNRRVSTAVTPFLFRMMVLNFLYYYMDLFPTYRFGIPQRKS